MSDRTDEMRDVVRVARAARVEVQVVVECVERELIPDPASGWSDEAVEAVRRVRRLNELGVNMAGIEVITHMRRRMRRMRREMASLEREMRKLRRQHDREVTRLLRELSRGPGE